jgi:hypothetical protein
MNVIDLYTKEILKMADTMALSTKIDELAQLQSKIASRLNTWNTRVKKFIFDTLKTLLEMRTSAFQIEIFENSDLEGVQLTLPLPPPVIVFKEHHLVKSVFTLYFVLTPNAKICAFMTYPQAKGLIESTERVFFDYFEQTEITESKISDVLIKFIDEFINWEGKEKTLFIKLK